MSIFNVPLQMKTAFMGPLTSTETVRLIRDGEKGAGGGGGGGVGGGWGGG